MVVLSLLVAVGCGSSDTGVGVGAKQQDIVQGTGGMTVDPPEELVISDIQPEYSKSGEFTITSVGDGNLILYEVRIVADETGSFYFDQISDDVTLAPGQTVTYPVSAQLDGADPAHGQLRIRTNDPQNANFILNLTATPEGYVPPDTGGDTGGDTGTGADTGGAGSP